MGCKLLTTWSLQLTLTALYTPGDCAEPFLHTAPMREQLLWYAAQRWKH